MNRSNRHQHSPTGRAFGVPPSGEIRPMLTCRSRLKSVHRTRIRKACRFSVALLLTIITHVLWPAEIHGQTLAISPPPGQVVIVTNPRAYSLTKHPTLPVLYLTCSGAPESTNLITLRLNADGTLVRDSQRTWPDYLTTNPTNENFRYAIPRPIVLAEERILYLASCPVDPPRYCADTNNNEVAVIGLDGQGQPGKLLKA